MAIGRLRRLAASAGIVALTFGAGALAITNIATATSTMTATAYVNLRSGPGTSYAILGVLSPGQAVQASGTVTNGWYEVTSNGRTGWVYKNYLRGPTMSTEPAPAPTTSASTSITASGSVTTTANVNVRSGPGTSHSIVAVASKGMQLATTGETSSGWTQVVHAGTPRWIASSYLATSSGATTTAVTTQVSGQLRTTASLYLRTGGTPSAPSDGILPANSLVDATGRTTAEYSEITHQGKLRWIASRYTSGVAATAPAAPAAPAASGAVYVDVNALNVRATSEPTGTVVGVVTRGTRLDTTGVTEGDRTQVLHMGAARWVYTPFVTTAVPATALSVSPPAGVTTSGLAQLNPNAKAVAQYVLDNYPKIRTIYGWRASSSYSSDHPSGRAVDIMIANWGDPAMADYGWEVARYFADNPGPYKVNYIIYRQSIFNVRYPERGWRPMEDRGGATANHYDHVHVSVFD